MPHARTSGWRSFAVLSCHTTLLLLAISNPLLGGLSASITRDRSRAVGAPATVQRSTVWARRDPILRAGHWTPALLRDLYAVRFRAQLSTPDFWAAAVALNGALPVLSGEGEGGSGLGTPGEGIGVGGTPVVGESGGVHGFAWSGPLSRVNTNTGNHHLQLPLLAWDGRGATQVEFELYHNSLSAWAGDMGHSWSHTYETRIDHTPGSSAILRWADGTNVAYTETSGTFVPPPGFFDRLTRQTDGTWELEQPDHQKFGFDPSGYLVWIRDRAGNQVSVSRTGDHRILSVADSSGRALSFQYGVQGRLEAVSDPLGRTWSFEYQSLDLQRINYPALNQQIHSRTFAYDANHNVIECVDLEGSTNHYGYDSQQRLIWFDDALGNRWTYTYTTATTSIMDPLGNVLKHHYALGLLTGIEDELGYCDHRLYNSAKLIVAYRDRNDELWQYAYDSMGRVLSEVDPLGAVESRVYDSGGDLVSVTNSLGYTRAYLYDANHSLIQAIDPTGVPILTIQYDAYGQVASTTDATGATSIAEHDSFGNLISCAMPGELPVMLQYDLLGNPTRITDQFGNQTNISWDTWGRPTLVRHPDPSERTYTFDLEDRLTGLTDERGHFTSIQYDPNGRPIRLTEPTGGFATWTYDAAGRTIAERNPRGSVTSFQHTARSELQRVTFADGAWIEWSFDPCGNPISRATSAQEFVWFGYDPCGRTVLVDFPSGPDTRLTYDLAGRLIEMTDETGTSHWQYDSCDRVTRLDMPQGSLTATYDIAGQVQSVSEVGGGSWSVVYDTAGRPIALRDPVANLVAFQYDPAASRLVRRTFGNGLSEEFAYDSRSRPTSQVLKTSSGLTLAQTEIEFDAASNVTSLTKNGTVATYEYDANDRLVRETFPGFEALYTYDLNGNRIERTINGAVETYEYDAGDKLLAVHSAQDNRTYAYDGFGRLVSVQSLAGTTQLTYGPQGRLASIASTFGPTVQYRYTGLGARTDVTVDTETTHFLRTGPDVLDTVLGINSARVLPDAAISVGSNTRYVHGGLKSFDAQSDTQQALVATHSTDAFGNTLQTTGSWEGPFQYGGRFGYQVESNSAFLLVGERYYDPTTGRFLSRDPALEGFNWYAYCDNNPASYTDPDGRFPWLIVAAVLLLTTEVAIAPTSPEDLKPERVAHYHEELSQTKLDLLYNLVGPKGKTGFFSIISRALQKAPAVKLEGQLHHVISKKVYMALEKHHTLKGLYKLRDPRFTARAATLEDHRGYQTWHRKLDNDIADVLNKNKYMTRKEFEAWLHKRYSKPDLARRFPAGIQPATR